MNIRKIIFGVLLLGSTSVGFSQGKVIFGIKAGMNVATLTGNFPKEFDAQSKIGLHMGATLEIEVTPKISVLSEVLFSTQGNKGAGLINTANFQQNTSLSSINVPVMLRYKVLPKLSIEFGPQIGYLVSAKSTFNIQDPAFPEDSPSFETDLLKDGTFLFQDNAIPYKKYFNQVDFSLNLGTTFDITETLYVQARYSKGINNLNVKEVDRASIYRATDLKNALFQLSVGYRF